MRIRDRRKQLGLSLAELARRVGVRAPSFIHYIENGFKAPSEEIARKLAQALGDDEAVYTAWARIRLGTTWKAALYDHQVLRRAIFGPEQAPRLVHRALLARSSHPDERSVEDDPMSELGMIGNAAMARDDRWLEAPGPALLIKVPVLPEAADPDQEREPMEVLRLDPRLLPRDAELLRPFAYRLSAESVARVPEQLRPGDLALITRSAWPLHPEEVYAVRMAGRVALSRTAWEDGALWALRGERGGREGAETWQALGTGTPPPALVGRVALVVRGSSGRA